ncbi:iron-binding protein [Rhodoferax lacus]|uniref:Iron-binding protein n=1 Tax=Rhodoferax lacus TaxID=2184758 RepID=A0A3E1R8H8_9BURK|nr:CDGSH iron-sulfur domain-containing protein [Rhodoferax lacus]RFO95666.1 iron-binding protein [Rhodoferax lacus]
MTLEVVTGKEATIHFDAGKCIHSRTCVLSHPDVFVPNVVGAWIHPDAQPVEELIRIGQNCPSGAITVVRIAASPTAFADSNQPPLVNTVRVRENGPLAVEAELQIQGQPQANPRATLCRCGQSQNKPYCDGSHVAAGFVASGEPATASFEALAVRNGPLKVLPQPNGPLRLTGNLEVVSGTGRTCNKVTDTWLCRCGHSQNKPYCDGSHKAAGFVAV